MEGRPIETRQRLTISTLALVACGLASSACAQATNPAIESAREGGLQVVCRHAITNDFREQEPLDYADPSTQRQLNDEGEEQSRRMGEAFRRLGITFAEVIASPMHRAYRTAELMQAGNVRQDSIWHTNDGDYDGPNRTARLEALAIPVSAGNRLIVSHIGTMSSVLPSARNRVGEGDCVLVRPEAGGHSVVGIVEWEEWLEAAGRTE